MKARNINTKNTYEASFYIMFGAKLEKVRTLVLNKTTAKHRGYPVMWTLCLSNVPGWAIETWRTGNAYGNITEYVDVRNK